MNQGSANSANAAIVFDSDFQRPELIALLDGRHAMFAAVLNPFEGTAQQPRRCGHGQFFRVCAIFRTKTSADFGGDHPQLVVLKPKHL